MPTSFCHRDPSTVDDVSPLDTLNAVRWYGDKRYRYIHFKTGTAVVGKLVFRHTDDATTAGTCTMTAGDCVAETLGTVADPVGVLVKALTTAYYGYVLVDGHGSVYTDDGVVVGDFLVADGAGSPDGIADTAVAGEEHAVFARALANDDDTTHLVTARVYCRG